MAVAKMFLEDAQVLYKRGSYYSVPLLCFHAVEHAVIALAYRFDPGKAEELDSHSSRAYWLTMAVRRGLVDRRLVRMFNDLARYSGRSTYSLENGGLA